MSQGNLAHIPPFEFNRITSYILAGRNPLTAEDVKCLIAEGVTHLLDLREPKEWTAPLLGQEALEAIERNRLRRMHLPIMDMGAPTTQDFDAAVHFLEETLRDPKAQIYVHCRAGRERTAAILTAYYARQNHVSYRAALAILKKARPTLNPLDWQAEAVRDWLGE